MLQFNRSSWHYKFQNYFMSDWGEPTNLCQYVRRIIFSFLMAVGLGIILSTIFVAAMFAYLFPVWDALFSLIGIEMHSKEIGYTAFMVAWVFTLFGIYDYNKRKIKNYMGKGKNKDKPEKIKKPNVFVEYLKAKKQKICPMVTFND